MRSEASRDLSLSVMALTGVLVLTALVAINLVERMTPKVERVLMENVYSAAAVHEMLAALASSSLPEPAARRASEQFAGALSRAAGNITEPQEEALIRELRQLQTAAFAGDALALERALAVLTKLDEVNRAAMSRAARESSHLGNAGAWALALLGMSGVGLSLLLLRRLRRRLVAPLYELERVLLSLERGESHQRCATVGYPAQLRRLFENLNRLLDSHRKAEHTDGSAAPNFYQQLLPGLLDTCGGPLALVDPEGRVIATSRRALEVLGGEHGMKARDGIAAVISGGSDPSVSLIQRTGSWSLVSLSDGS